MMKSIVKIVVPSIFMVVLIYLWRDGKDILKGLYLVFPFMYILMGIICSDLKKELLVSLVLLSISFFIPINLWYHMGSCVCLVIFYNLLSFISYSIRSKIKNNM